MTKTRSFIVTATTADQDVDLFDQFGEHVASSFDGTAIEVVGVQRVASLEALEREIRGAAGHVSNSVRNRESHPTYGYTKVSIRNSFQQMRGMINLYAFLSDQTMNAQGIAPLQVQFLDEKTRNMVQTAILDHGSL